MNYEHNDFVGDDQVYYSQSYTDELVKDAELMYRDFKNWLEECAEADAVFDTVISPYTKGKPPSNARISSKKQEYDATIKDAKKVFEQTLEEIINYIIDYSNNSTLMVPQEVSAGSSDMVNLEKFEIVDEVLTEETVIIGETTANDEVIK